VTGIVDLNVLVSRAGEFEDTRASGFSRFIGPFWVTADYFHLASVRALLVGNGPGTTGAFTAGYWYAGGVTATWTKLLYEYGFIGSFVFVLFLAACFRGTPCASLVVVAVLVSYVFLGGNLLQTPFLIMMIVLATLSGTSARSHHMTNRYRPSLMAGSGVS
jgi:hypothetical protein